MTPRTGWPLWSWAMIGGIAMLAVGMLLVVTANAYPRILLGSALVLAGTAFGAVGSKKIKR